MPGALEEPKLKGAVLRDAAVEAAFRARSMPADSRTVAFVAAVTALGLFWTGARAWGTEPRLALLQLGLGAMTVALAAALARVRSPASLDALVLGWVLAATAQRFLYLGALPPSQHGHLMFDVLAVLALWLVVPNHFHFQAAGAALFTGMITAVFALFRDPLEAGSDEAVVLAFFAANLLGAVGSWRLHRSRRLEFAQRSELETALEEIRTIRGVVPICGRCKSIYTEGSWQRLEVALATKTNAQVEQGMCPNCFDLLKPEGQPPRQ